MQTVHARKTAVESLQKGLHKHLLSIKILEDLQVEKDHMQLIQKHMQELVQAISIQQSNVLRILDLHQWTPTSLHIAKILCIMEKLDPALSTWSLKTRKKCVEEVNFSFMDVAFAQKEMTPSHQHLTVQLDASSWIIQIEKN